MQTPNMGMKLPVILLHVKNYIVPQSTQNCIFHLSTALLKSVSLIVFLNPEDSFYKYLVMIFLDPISWSFSKVIPW